MSYNKETQSAGAEVNVDTAADVCAAIAAVMIPVLAIVYWLSGMQS